MFEDIPFAVTVVDEAHRLRNQKGKLLEVMKSLSFEGEKVHGFQLRTLITGTPLQNNIDELWTLLNFVDPVEFDDHANFQRRFGALSNREEIEGLQRKLSPYMLRRVKEDVAKDIPEKSETVIDVELTAVQKQYYRAIFEKNHSFLIARAGVKAGALMNVQMELRKCCNHPYLLDGVEEVESAAKQEALGDSGLESDRKLTSRRSE